MKLAISAFVGAVAALGSHHSIKGKYLYQNGDKIREKYQNLGPEANPPTELEF